MSDRRPAPNSAALCDGTSVSSHRSRATCYPLSAKLCFLIKSIVKERLDCVYLGSPPFSARPSPIPFSHAALRKSRSYVRECLRRVTVARGQNRELSKFIRLSRSPREVSSPTLPPFCSSFRSYRVFFFLFFFLPRTLDKFQIALGSNDFRVKM